jgi:pantoate--beta-alanine ligase
MLLFSKPAELSHHLKTVCKDKSVGFVPTMGALHQGHLSLLNESFKENQATVLSIFVNPTQFNNADDLANYPRTLESDLQKVSQLNHPVIVFTPQVDDMYVGQTQSESFDMDGLETRMEGRYRKGHFDGVATIVKRLFEIVEPTAAYFGEKDFQQLQIVRRLVSKHNLPVRIVGCPVFREPNGLAMSSRNERLSATVRHKAGVISQALELAKDEFLSTDIQTIAEKVSKLIAGQGFDVEYFEIADEETLEPFTDFDTKKKYRAFIAVFAEGVRLIDTIALN